MANRWTNYVKQWAKKKGMSYGCALSQPQLKKDYRKAYPTKEQERFREGVERGEMEDEDINVTDDGDQVRKQLQSYSNELASLRQKQKKKPTQKSKENMSMAQEDLLSRRLREENKREELERSEMGKEDKRKKPAKINKERMSMIQEDLLSQNLRGVNTPAKAKKVNTPPPAPPAKKKGRPKKYETAEEARRMRIEKTKESNKRMREKRKQALLDEFK